LAQHVELLVLARQQASAAEENARRTKDGFERQLLTITERLVRLQQASVSLITLLDDAGTYVPPELRATVTSG